MTIPNSDDLIAPKPRNKHFNMLVSSRSAQIFWRNPNAVLGIILVMTMALTAFLAPLLAPGNPLAMVGRPLLWPGQDMAHPLGTDAMGRDMLAGLLHGASISLFVGFVAAALGLSIGLVIGALAGYYGGRIDDFLSRVIEIFQTLPSFVLVVVLVAVTKPSAWTIALAIGIVTWPNIARLVRAEFRSLRERDFVQAARSLGYSDLRIICHEILPNALPPIIVTTSVMVATAILMESALSFMGLGDPNQVSWGMMIGNGREMIRSAWFLTALPGFSIVLAVLALNMIGDGLNDAFNPRFHKRG